MRRAAAGGRAAAAVGDAAEDKAGREGPAGTGIKAGRWKVRHKGWQTECQAGGKSGSHTGGQVECQAERQAGRQEFRMADTNAVRHVRGRQEERQGQTTARGVVEDRSEGARGGSRATTQEHAGGAQRQKV